jgi:hypothetical protein
MIVNHLDLTRDLVVSVPRPQRHIRIVMFGLLAYIALCFALFAGALYEFLTLAPSDRRPGSFSSFVSSALMWATTSACFVRGFLEWNRPLVISAAGIDLRGISVPWSKIISCRWNHFSAGTLNITMRQDDAPVRQYASIPDAERPLVGRALRDLGKWEEELVECAAVA